METETQGSSSLVLALPMEDALGALYFGTHSRYSHTVLR